MRFNNFRAATSIVRLNFCSKNVWTCLCIGHVPEILKRLKR